MVWIGYFKEVGTEFLCRHLSSMTLVLEICSFSLFFGLFCLAVWSSVVEGAPDIRWVIYAGLAIVLEIAAGWHLQRVNTSLHNWRKTIFVSFVKKLLILRLLRS